MEGTAGRPAGGQLFWGGLGGALVIGDLDAGMTFANTPNRMSDTLADVRGLGLLMATWEAMSLI